MGKKIVREQKRASQSFNPQIRRKTEQPDDDHPAVSALNPEKI
jgi:hypothetical protein